MQKSDIRVAVIGAGPAGLMAAGVLAAAGVAVHLFDAMPAAGRKFLVAGRGGLNLTNAEEPAAFVARYGEQADFFRGILADFSPADLRRWCRDLGVDTYVGSSGKVFPRQAGARDLLTAWLEHLKQGGVMFHFQHRWQGVAADNAPLFLTANGDRLAFPASAILLALGGASWPQTGSDGAWAEVLAARGVCCTPFRPANCGIEVTWSAHFRERFAGAPLKNLQLRCGDRQAVGEVVITGYGLEGGGIYQLIPALRQALDQERPAFLFLDLKRDLTVAQLLEKFIKKRRSDTLANFLRKSLRLAGPAYSLLREFGGQAQLTDPVELARCIKNLPVPVSGLQPLVEAISTAGGIAMAELDENLMLIRLPGFFAAGEMLDWEAPTGGYLLQGAFSTGYRAAGGILRWLRR